jgi:hypothetical protein
VDVRSPGGGASKITPSFAGLLIPERRRRAAGGLAVTFGSFYQARGESPKTGNVL